MKRLLLTLIWFGLFLLRFFSSQQTGIKLGHLIGKPISLSGRISSEVILQGISQKFRMNQIDIVAGSDVIYEYSQKVEISGTLQRKVINRWYNRFSLIYPHIKIINGYNKNAIRYWLIRFRQAIQTVYNRILPEPEASLMAGIVLGVKTSLPQEFYMALQKTGTMHIVVASGFNVTIIMGSLIAWLAGPLRRRWAVLAGIILVWLYALMAGFGPAIVRAAIMGSAAYLGQLLGRQSVAWRLLLLSAMVMLLVSPLLIFDIGFQLSFLATSGLILISPYLPAWLPQGTRETLSAQIMVWPILLVNFGQVSLIGILVNSVIVLLVPYVMALAFLPWLAYLPLTIMVRIIELFNRL
jgi:competence protein ComEC